MDTCTQPNQKKTNRNIDPEDEKHRAYLTSLTDKEFMTFQIAKEIQIDIFDITATNHYIQWIHNIHKSTST